MKLRKLFRRNHSDNETDENAKPKSEAKNPSKDWRNIAKGAFHDLWKGSFIANLVVGLAFVFVCLGGALFVKTQRVGLICIAIGLTVIFWIIVFAIYNRMGTRTATANEPKQRPYVFIREDALVKPLVAGEPIAIRIVVENSGPGEATLTMRNATNCFSELGITRSFKYQHTDAQDISSITLAPKTPCTVNLRFRYRFLTNEELKALNDGPAKIYFFAQGEYKDENGGTYPLIYRRMYDKDWPGNLIVCPDSVTIE